MHLLQYIYYDSLKQLFTELRILLWFITNGVYVCKLFKKFSLYSQNIMLVSIPMVEIEYSFDVEEVLCLKCLGWMEY